MGTKRFNFIKGLFGIFVALLLTFTLIACGGDKDQEFLDEAIDNLSVVFASGDSAASVTRNINLPTALGEATVSWASNDTTVLTNTGVVTRRFGNTPVTLTATATLNEATATKAFSLIVIGHDVDAALDSIVLAGANVTFDADTNLYTITGDISLPTVANGLDITWVSTNPSALSTAGVVVRPVYGQNNANVTLIASINDEERDFYIVVPAIPDKPIDLILEEAKNQLLLSGISEGVAQDLTLPLKVGLDDVTVTWTSNRLTIISIVGNRAIVERQDENEVVILTATLTKGNQSVTKEFEVVVLANEPAVEVENIAAAIALGQDKFVFISAVTILGITGDGVVFHDSSGIMFAYFGSRRTDLVVGNVYDVQGLTARFFGSWQLGNTAAKPIIFTPSTGEKTEITPVEVGSVTEMLENHHVPDAVNPNINYVYYRLTAKIRIQSSIDNYGTVFVDPNYNGPDIPTAANTAHTDDGVIVYYHSNKAAFDAFDGQIVTFNILLYGYRSDRNIFSTLYLESVEDIEVGFTDQGAVDAAEILLKNSFMFDYAQNTTLTLPTSVFGTEITWESSNSTLINATTGALTLPAEGSTEVTLTATVKMNDVEKEVEIKINVGEVFRTVLAVREASTGTVLSTKGTITAVSFDNNDVAVVYIEDATAGIYLYKVSAAYKDLLVVGNTIEVRASRAYYTTGQTIQLNNFVSIKVITPSVPVTPTLVTDPDALENVQGQLVSVTGYLKENYTGTPNTFELVTLEGTFFLQVVGTSDAVDLQRTAIINKLVGVAPGTEITVVAAASRFGTKLEIALFDANQITIGALGSTSELDAVALEYMTVPEASATVLSNITLPLTGLFGTTFTWTSSNPAVISNTGVVTRSTETDVTVTLSYEFKSGATVLGSGNIIFTVLKDTGLDGTLMIYEVYGGGGNSGSYYKNDYIVLYNGTSAAIDLTGYSVQYASATGTSWQVTPLTGTIASGGFYLIQQVAGSGGTMNLPTPNATGTISMAQANFKVALVNSTTPLTGANPSGHASVIDFVGVGTADGFEGSGAAPAISNTTSAIRKNFIDTDDNANDFETVTNGAGHLDYLTTN